jgi:hypothetical protein
MSKEKYSSGAITGIVMGLKFYGLFYIPTHYLVINLKPYIP